MSAASFLLGLIDVIINCVIIVLVAFTVVWLLGLIGFPPSADMMKWGKILVLLLCVAIVLAWLLSLVGLGGGFNRAPHFFRSSAVAGGAHAAAGHWPAAHLQRMLT